MKHPVFTALIFLSLVLPIGGCLEKNLDPATAKQVAQIKSQAAKETAQVKADDAVATVKATANPTLHPFKANNDTVSKIRSWLVPVNVLAVVVLGIAVGFCFTGVTPLSWLSKILIPIAAAVAFITLTGILVLPFLPWVIYLAVAVAVGLLIYEIIRYRSGAWAQIKSDLTTAAHDLEELVPGDPWSLAGSFEKPILAEAKMILEPVAVPPKAPAPTTLPAA
jgi:hypothetical protein